MTIICVFAFLWIANSPPSFLLSSERTQSFTPQSYQASSLDSMDSFVDYAMRNVSTVAPRDFKKMKLERTKYYQRGYIRILRDYNDLDAFSVLISYVKTILNVEFGMIHKTFWIVAPNRRLGIKGVPYPDDWNFPSDPWRREWWFSD